VFIIEVLKDIKWKMMSMAHSKYYRYSEEQFVSELGKWYEKNLGTKLNLDEPKTFNEKIQWLKLFDSTEEKARLADKLACREWAADVIGEEYLIPLISWYNSFDEINFDELPESFVLKTNHASSTNVIVKDKSQLNIKETRMKFNRWLTSNYGFNKGFELHYGMIPPKIVCEKYMGDNLCDYKFFCFDGNPEFIWVDVGRYINHCRNTYDLSWNELPFVIGNFERVRVEKPKNLELMAELAKKLSKNFEFVRVDFYEIDGKVYFGEMTFTTASGTEKFYPNEYDLICGEKINLPQKKSIPLNEIKSIWRNKK
jgi:hypothetical protein